jgi:hypothetical protein
MAGNPKAVVLLSGGLDSATTLAIARDQGFDCHTVSFDYGQRHTAELSASMDLAQAMGSTEHRIMRIGLGALGGSALTDERIAVPDSPGEGIPVTYVPARNTVFLSLALGYAEVIGSFCIGFGPTIGGALIGAVWGFVVGFVFHRQRHRCSVIVVSSVVVCVVSQVLLRLGAAYSSGATSAEACCRRWPAPSSVRETVHIRTESVIALP